MRIEVNIDKKYLVILIVTLVILTGVIFTYAYNSNFDSSATNGVISGHSADELVVRLNNGSLITVQNLLKGSPVVPTCVEGQTLRYTSGQWGCASSSPSLGASCDWNGDNPVPSRIDGCSQYIIHFYCTSNVISGISVTTEGSPCNYG